MCAGISFNISELTNPDELTQFFTPEEIKKQIKGETVESFYWQSKPFLPVEEDDGVHLYHWGNREKAWGLPKTGWARLESVQDGLWDRLKPKLIWIPSAYGFEKKKWFKTEGGIKGLKVRSHNLTRIYILTKKASQEFIEYTGHDRMPLGKLSLPIVY